MAHVGVPGEGGGCCDCRGRDKENQLNPEGWSNLVLVVLEQHYSNPPIFGYLQKSWGLSAGGATQCCGMSRVPNFPKNIFWLKNQRSPMWRAASQAGESAWISLDINVALVLSGDIANRPPLPTPCVLSLATAGALTQIKQIFSKKKVVSFKVPLRAGHPGSGTDYKVGDNAHGSFGVQLGYLQWTCRL